jgi:hypothetical protein
MATRRLNPLPFWIERQMVLAKINKQLLVFDRERLLAVAKEELLRGTESDDVNEILQSFRVLLNSDFLQKRGEPGYRKVAALLMTMIRSDDPRLNAETLYYFEGVSDAARVIEDVSRAVCFNSNAFWVTATPRRFSRDSEVIEIKQIVPQSWLLRKLGLKPRTIETATFSLQEVRSISGNSFSFTLQLEHKSLTVGPKSLNWSVAKLEVT